MFIFHVSLKEAIGVVALLVLGVIYLGAVVSDAIVRCRKQST